MPTTIVKSYDTKLDNKKRVTLRSAEYQYYFVEEMSDGTIVFRPRVLVAPEEISAKTLKAMDAAVENLRKGKASKPINVAKYSKAHNSSTRKNRL
jgi:hypothetical protein